MKKYIAPEVEIKKFNVENIMTDSGNVAFTDADVAGAAAGGVETVTYGDLFTLN